jgi:hypothetical protein
MTHDFTEAEERALSLRDQEEYEAKLPKPRAGEHVPALSESLRLSAPSHIYQRALKLEAERDLLREREKALVEVAQAILKVLSTDEWHLEDAQNKARAALVKVQP